MLRLVTFVPVCTVAAAWTEPLLDQGCHAFRARGCKEQARSHLTGTGEPVGRKASGESQLPSNVISAKSLL